MKRLIYQLMLVGLGVAFAPLVQAEEVKNVPVHVIQAVRVAPVLNPHFFDTPVTAEAAMPHCYRVEKVRNVSDTQQLTPTAMAILLDNKNLQAGNFTTFDATTMPRDTACADEGK